MKSFKVNAKVKVNFNDSTKIVDGEPYKWEKGETIKDMPRERFEQLEALGYVEEDKSFTSKNKEEWE
jgi:hypothetical protein